MALLEYNLTVSIRVVYSASACRWRKASKTRLSKKINSVPKKMNMSLLISLPWSRLMIYLIAVLVDS